MPVGSAHTRASLRLRRESGAAASVAGACIARIGSLGGTPPTPPWVHSGVDGERCCGKDLRGHGHLIVLDCSPPFGTGRSDDTRAPATADNCRRQADDSTAGRRSDRTISMIVSHCGPWCCDDGPSAVWQGWLRGSYLHLLPPGLRRPVRHTVRTTDAAAAPSFPKLHFLLLGGAEGCVSVGEI